jgi:hypothetical protein
MAEIGGIAIMGTVIDFFAWLLVAPCLFWCVALVLGLRIQGQLGTLAPHGARTLER